MNTKFQSENKRIRVNPIKKWTVQEEKLLIEFLLHNRNGFEGPTAQLYYRRFCYEKKLNIDWKLVRSKVRNMRVSYTKTRAALETISPEDSEEYQHTLKKCNYYNELDMIFADRFTNPSSTNAYDNTMSSDNYNPLLDSDDETTVASEKYDVDVLPTSSTKFNGIFKSSPIPSTTQQQPDPLQIKSFCSIKTNFVPDNPQETENENFKIKQQELHIKEKELQLQERRLELKEKKIISQENIKIQKINSREKLKILEMEMNERLALEELKLKYK